MTKDFSTRLNRKRQSMSDNLILKLPPVKRNFYVYWNTHFIYKNTLNEHNESELKAIKSQKLKIHTKEQGFE